MREMVVDWLAAGLDPERSTIFVQSQVPGHAELHLLLSMITPLGWLERVPTYKDQQAQLKEKDLATYGFLGYPLLQSADILIYRPAFVPVGEDQVAHVEMTRELARRFNNLYGKDPRVRGEGEGGAGATGCRPARAIPGPAAPLPGRRRSRGAGRGASPGAIRRRRWMRNSAHCCWRISRANTTSCCRCPMYC